MAASATESETSMATRAAWLSYIGGYTQSQIAKRLGVSPAKVHRLIATAHQSGLVKVFVEGEPAACISLENEISKAFGLNFCSVAPSLGEDEDTVFSAISAIGARFLVGAMERYGSAPIGVGHGRTLAAVAERIPKLSHPDVKFVAMLGCLTRRAATNPFGVVHKLAERTGGEGYFLPVPFIADSIADKTVLMAQKSVRDVLSLADKCRLVVVGIGELGPRAHMRRTHMITEQEYEALKAADAVGDLLGQFFDAKGGIVDCELNQRACGVDMEMLRNREVVAVAGGPYKSTAIVAALRSGIISGLITDEMAAREIVQLLRETPPEQAPRKRAHEVPAG